MTGPAQARRLADGWHRRAATSLATIETHGGTAASDVEQLTGAYTTITAANTSLTLIVTLTGHNPELTMRAEDLDDGEHAQLLADHAHVVRQWLDAGGRRLLWMHMSARATASALPDRQRHQARTVYRKLAVTRTPTGAPARPDVPDDALTRLLIDEADQAADQAHRPTCARRRSMAVVTRAPQLPRMLLPLLTVEADPLLTLQRRPRAILQTLAEQLALDRLLSPVGPAPRWLAAVPAHQQSDLLDVAATLAQQPHHPRGPHGAWHGDGPDGESGLLHIAARTLDIAVPKLHLRCTSRCRRPRRRA